MIRTEQLSSTALTSCTYDDEAQTLDVTFVSGGTYTYHNVPPEVYAGLVSASSAGRYWHSNIKDQY